MSTANPALRPTGSPSHALDAPGSASRRLVMGVVGGCVVIAGAAMVAVTFPSTLLGVAPGFNWAYVTLYLVTGVVTAVLLMQATPESWSRSTAVLASGYIYSALATVPFLLSFPGAFEREPVPLVGGSQSSVWTFYLWHLGFLAFVLRSTVLARRTDVGRGDAVPRVPTRGSVVVWGVAPAAVLAVVVLALPSRLPVLLGPGLSTTKTATYHVLSWSVVAFGLVTLGLAIAVARRGSQLRVWLLPVVLLTTFQAVQLRNGGRYRLGWYAPRVVGMIATTLLLVALLQQVWRQARALVVARTRSDRLATVLEQSPSGLAVLDRDGIVTEVNDAMCDLTGFERADLVGARGDVPFEGDDAIANLGTLLVGEARSVTVRGRIVRRDGESLWVDLTAQRLTDDAGEPNGVALSVADASGAVAADLDPDAPVGLAVLTVEGAIVRANEALCTLLGTDRSSLVGVALQDLICAADRDSAEAALDPIRQGASDVASAELRLLSVDDRPFWASMYRTALRDARGELVGLAVQVIDIEDRKRAEAAASEAQRFLEYRSTYDDVTGVLNRPSFIDRVQEALQRGSTMALLVVDVDRFRRVSNSTSRRDGDAVLSEIAQRLASMVDERAVIARVGGDEFALGIPIEPVNAAALAVQWATRVRDQFADTPFTQTGHDIYLTCCVGVTVASPGDAAADRMQEADLATHDAKEAGQAHCRLYDQRMRQGLLTRIDVIERIRAALGTGEFRAWFQPVVSLPSGRLCGYEALSRWVRPDGSIIAPDDYLPAAEDSGLVVPIGASTVDAALARLAELPAPLTMAINASPTELLATDFAGHLESGIRRHDLDARRVIVEITEQALFDVERAADAGLTRLVDLGVALHMDDFGTGYSSIIQLRDFPIRGIKLDRSFTAELDGPSERATEIASTLAELANRLGLDSVAEGVETREQADRLAQMGWREGQGWLFGRPQPAPSDNGSPVRATT